MPRRPRIEIAGYYHIINRGVEQRVIFKKPADFEKLEDHSLLQELKHASSLVEAPNIDKIPDIEKLRKGVSRNVKKSQQ